MILVPPSYRHGVHHWQLTNSTRLAHQVLSYFIVPGFLVSFSLTIPYRSISEVFIFDPRMLLSVHVWWWGGRRRRGHLLLGEKWPCSAQTLPFLPRYLPVLPRSPFLCAPTPTAQPQIGISALQYSSCIVLCVGLKIDFGILIVNVWTNWPFGWFW